MNLLHRWYCRSDHWGQTVRDRILPWVLADAALGEDVLEVGPGPGRVTDILRDRVTHLTSLEIDPALARSLQGRFEGTNVDVRLGDGTRMDFPDDTFSGALSMTMLHHVPSPELQDALLAQVRRVLRPGATFVGCDSRTSAGFRVAHLFDTLVPVDPATFGERLAQAGFRDIQVDTNARAFRFHAVA